METKVVLADFANEKEFNYIRNKQRSERYTLAVHRAMLANTKIQLQLQGYEVAVEICDLNGYLEFCKLQNALNTPATVAAYVAAKHGGVDKENQEGLKEVKK